VSLGNLRDASRSGVSILGERYSGFIRVLRQRKTSQKGSAGDQRERGGLANLEPRFALPGPSSTKLSHPLPFAPREDEGRQSNASPAALPYVIKKRDPERSHECEEVDAPIRKRCAAGSAGGEVPPATLAVMGGDGEIAELVVQERLELP